MEPTRGPLDRFDVPLVWERAPHGAPPPASEPARRRPPAPEPWSRIRLWVAALADLGVVLLALAAAWTVAATLGVSLTPAQLATGSLAGGLLAAVIGVGVLWGWRASPGMALLHLRFAVPLELSRALRVWLGWLCCLPLLGLPLLLGRRGHTLAERLAGGEITLHSP